MALWSEERTEMFREFMSETGASFAKIASLMSEKYHCAYTRNAMVGKARRLGIPSNNPPSKPQILRAEPVVMVRRRKPQPQPPTPVAPEAAALRSADVIPRHISLLELTSKTCHWPYGETPPLTYCGNPVFFKNCPYCGGHFDLSHRGGS